MREVPLSELIVPAGKRAGRDNALPVYSVTKHAGFVPSLEYFKKQVFSRDVASYKQVEPGDFAYATIHLDEGSIGIAPERGLISPMYTVFRSDDSRVDPTYLVRFLKSPRAMAHYSQLGRGAIHRRKSISLESLGRLRVPIVPLTQQRRIAAILDHADALRTKRRQVLAHLDALTRSAFRANFLNVTETSRLGDLATTTSGGTPSRSVSSNYGGGIPWVKSGELHTGLITETEETISKQGLSSSSAKVFPAGTVLLAMYGATAGVVGRLGIDAATNQAICAISPAPSLLPEFLVSALRAQTSELVAKAAGGAQPNLSQRIVRDILIPVPSIEDQARFTSQITAIEAHRSKVIRSQVIEDELFASLQSRAFRGEL